ncbi:MAG: hypothetical protein NC131_16105 [Roseburia sp.]|nr:hypothetical protein [Roseburia sp.]
MLFYTGHTILEVGQVYIIGKKINGKTKQVLGLYVKDIFGNENIYQMKAADVIRIWEDILKGKPVNITSYNVYTNVKTLDDLYANDLSVVSLEETKHVSIVESRYNFDVANF